MEERTMISRGKWSIFASIMCVALLGGYSSTASVSTDRAQAKHEHSRIAFSHVLPQLDGAHLEATVVEVNYGPGESSAPHSHPCAVIGYIVEGTYRTQVKGEPEAIYKPGETFYEAPNGIHLVSANASQTAPLRFVAYFTCDHHVPLSTEVSENKSP
jgi:quercetin dioxygenase-like cupin family protein